MICCFGSCEFDSEFYEFVSNHRIPKQIHRIPKQIHRHLSEFSSLSNFANLSNISKPEAKSQIKANYEIAGYEIVGAGLPGALAGLPGHSGALLNQSWPPWGTSHPWALEALGCPAARGSQPR